MFSGKIAAVSYLNTVPMLYGVERSAELGAGLLLSPPAGCAEAFRSGEADIALVPVGALSELEDYRIITNFCIGASGPVRTVVLVSQQPVDRVGRILLDPHSRTSAALVQVLCRHRWKVAPRFEPLTGVDAVGATDGCVLIGDKVFDNEGRFAVSYDLAQEWMAMTGLPMVFAVWVARQKVPPSTVEALETALQYGVGHVDEAIEHYGHSDKTYARDYLTRNIDYRFDEKKKEALTLFQNLLEHDHIIPQAV
jgi:chorismate dehydratase